MFGVLLTVGVLFALLAAVVASVDYEPRQSEDTDRGPSPTIWGNCPVTRFQENPKAGYYFYDDFTRTALLATPTITTEADYNNGWKAFGSAGGTLVGANILGGQGVVLTETDDNQGVNMATLATPVKIARDQNPLWFEARFKVGTITNNDSGLLIGLMDAQTLTVILPITAAGALADVNFVGFHRLEGDGDQLDTIYKANGVTQVTVGTDVVGDLPTSTALVADTYVKVGFKFDPNGNGRTASPVITFYVNGFELPDYKIIPSAAGTDFPNDVNLGIVLALLCGSNNDSVFTVDWVRLAQGELNA